MKTKSIITSLIFILVAGFATSGRCQPEVVCVKDAVERKIDGIEKTKFYYIDNGEKRNFEEGECFLKKNGNDLLSWGYPTLNYIVRPDKEGELKAVTIIDDDARKDVFNRITFGSLLKIWDEDEIDNAKCFMAWYEPMSDPIRTGNPGIFAFEKGKRFNEYLNVAIDPKEKKGYPILFFLKDNKPVPPKPADTEDEKVIWSLISGDMKPLESPDTLDRLKKIEDRLGNGIIHYAAAFGYTDLLKSLINTGAEIDGKNDSNMTPLLLASAAGHNDVVKLLLQNRADIKHRDTDKRTALHYASCFGHEAVVKELIKYIKKVNVPDAFGYYPVNYAINVKHDSIVGLLAAKNARLEADRENQQLVLLSSVSSDNYNTVSFLLDQKARANEEIYGTTPLVVAAGKSGLEVVDLLVNSGAKIDKADNKQLTPLLSACLTGRPEVVKYLLDKGAAVNVKSKSGLSAIEAAVLRDDPDLIDLLISHGVDIETEDESGKTPFWIAAIFGHRKSMKKLLDAGARCNLDHENAIDLMEIAFRYDMPEAVNLALDQCLNADFMFYDKYPSTWVAEYYSSDEILELLLEHGAVRDEGENLDFAPVEELLEKPKIIESTPVYYPLDLKRKYGSRKFLVKVVVDEQGRVLFPKMIESTAPEVDRLVMATITKWRFTVPKRLSGEICSIIVNVPIYLDCEEIEKSTWELSEVDQVPRVISAIPPAYPTEYRNKGISGRVLLDIIIDENGTPEDVKVASLTHKGFSDAAIAAAKRYKFSPAYYQGKPVKIKVKLPISFDVFP